MFENAKALATITVSARMKNLESLLDARISPPFIIRLDGVSFSKLTRDFKKPFDCRFRECMVNTSVDLMRKFAPVTIFQISDEISMVFDAPFYNGRIQKLCSVVAGFTSTMFNKHLHNVFGIDAAECFDARIMECPDFETVADCLYWRSGIDGFRNAVSAISQQELTRAQVHGTKTADLIQLLAQKDIKIEAYGKENLFGTFFKKEEYIVPQYNTNLDILKYGHDRVCRRRVVSGSFDLKEVSAAERIAFMSAKYWNSVFPKV